MKRVGPAFALVLAFGAGGLSPALGKEPGAVVAKLFYQVCLMNLPYYEGASGVVEDVGYSLVPTDGGGEFEYFDEASGSWGAFDIAQEDNAGCSVFHESISETDAQQLGLALANRFSESEPRLWKYEGVPSGWTVPYNGKTLYIIYGEGGLSSDVRDK